MDYRHAKRVARCEDCEFYNYDEDLDAYYCSNNLDQDEMARFCSGYTAECPYFRFYDEYQSTRRQN